jgi:hypothetical protein
VKRDDLAALSPPAKEVPPQLDPLESARLHAVLPGLRRALRPDVMGAELRHQLLRDSITVDACVPGKALYLGADGCSLRFDLDVRGPNGSDPRRLLVLGRLLEDDEAVRRYERAIAPMAAAMAERPDMAPFARLVASLPDRLVVHPFPIDADLPTLVGATDTALAAEVLDAPGASCSVVLGHYGRRDRCVLRYERDTHDPRPCVYGKVYADDRGARVGPIVAALATAGPHAVLVPRFLGYRADLRLSLLEELPGQREPAGDVVDDAARIAAALHRSDITLGSVRSIDCELSELRDGVLLVERASTEMAAILRELLATIAAAASRSEPLPIVFSHGDFTHSQLLTGGGRCGLVDFDSIARAEPALDLGQFLGYLRMALAKAEPSAGRARADRLADRFLTVYADAADAPLSPDEVRSRAQVYETISLFRSTLHAWQKLKAKRVRTLFSILVDQVARLT